jgi:hypothetical protein
MLTWLVIGVGHITTKRVLLAILAEERSRASPIARSGFQRVRFVRQERRNSKAALCVGVQPQSLRLYGMWRRNRLGYWQAMSPPSYDVILLV